VTVAAAASSFMPVIQGLNVLSSRPLRIAVSDHLPDFLVKHVFETYAKPLALAEGRQIVFETVSNDDMLTNLDAKPFDGFITSPSLHSWLYQEHNFFGALPYGLTRSEKMRWLISDEGQALQQEFFGHLNLRPVALAIGADTMGCFAKKSIQSASDLRGLSIASSDLRGQWFARQGMKVSDLTPTQQIEHLNQGSLDISDIYPADASSFIAAQLNETADFSYWLFPEIKTAPTVYMLWKKSSWNEELQSKHRDEIAVESLLQVSQRWNLHQEHILKQISRYYPVHQVPNSVVDLFRKDAQELHRQLAARNDFSARIAKSLKLG
jgi:TRAP-type mannitol/chloroaromatic compound transport system substrate-binding protein